MAIPGNPADLAKPFTGELDAISAFDQGALAEGLTHAFHSDQTPPFGELLSRLFRQSNPDQKAGILNRIIGAVGPAGIAEAVAASGSPASLAKILLPGGGLTAAQAQQVTPEQVRRIAENAARKNPSIVDAAAGFYAQHPALVKALGSDALALLPAKISPAKE